MAIVLIVNISLSLQKEHEVFARTDEKSRRNGRRVVSREETLHRDVQESLKRLEKEGTLEERVLNGDQTVVQPARRSSCS